MGRYRDADESKRDDGTSNRKRNILIQCEGGTELQYFRGLKSNKKFLELVNVEPRDKIGPDRDDCDRESMIQIANDCLYYNRYGQYPYRYFVSFVLSFILKTFEKDPNGIESFGVKDRDEMVDRLRSIRDSEIYKMTFCNDSRYVENGIVVNKLELSKRIIENCKFDFNDNVDFYLPTNDELESDKCINDPKTAGYLVFDRDYNEEWGRGHQDYERWLEEFKKTDVIPIVTSPSFELWLYMHEAKDTEYHNPDYTPEYEMEIREIMVRKQHPNWIKEAIDDFIERDRDKNIQSRMKDLSKDECIENALKACDGHLPFFTNDIKKLKDHPGTMVGDFLRPLLKRHPNL